MREFSLEFFGRKVVKPVLRGGSVLCALCFVFCAQGAHAAVSIKSAGGIPSAGGAAGASTRVPGAAKLSGGTATIGGASAARSASAPRANTIGKYLSTTSNAVKPGSVVKVPTGGNGGNADLSNYYTIPETDALLDMKQDQLVAGSGINIAGNVISAVGGGGGTGIDGREVMLRNDSVSGYIQWKYDTDAAWTNLIAVASLTGAPGATGANGTDGREVVLRNDSVSGYLQWKYDAEPVTAWRNLADLASLGSGLNISGTPGNVMMFDATNGDSIADTGIHKNNLIVMPTAPQLTSGDGEYLIVATKSGASVSGPTYVRIY